ncbi:hypothetical protein SAMN05444164_5079 [Bradyrhizobium erythrophlei]|uniref:Uncharacterized protein n=1 Tax=Bradyrhizobium erythrophlei TaxID=1437360 RepID=A0A1H5BLK4_9BRAD|nr:hypothetical protein SAMN05444164_5079 [Bradyrhizobium erythrophlei]
MGVSHRRRCKWREQIPTRFALTSKATSPFQGEVGAAQLDHSMISFIRATSVRYPAAIFSARWNAGRATQRSI